MHCNAARSQPLLRSIYTSLLVLLALFFAAPAVAGTHWNSAVIGFSSDGRYAALEQSGVVDGIGLPDCYVELYDLDANTKIDLKPPQTEGTERKMYTCAEARTDARAALKGYGIDKKHQGSTLALESQSGEPDPNGTTPKITTMDFTFKKKTCRLKLYKKSDEGNNPWGRTMIRWNVGLSCGNEKERLILSEEWSNYSVTIEEARIVGDRLVLFPATTYQDFEEPGSSTGVIGIVVNQAPPEGVKLVMEVIGFSDSGDLFGYWLSGANKTTGTAEASLQVFSVPSGQEAFSKTIKGSDPITTLSQLKELTKDKLAEPKLGSDLGTELYKSGTAVSTKLLIDGKTYKVDLKTGTKSDDTNTPVQVVLTKPDNSVLTLQNAAAGYNRSLNTIRLSRDKNSVAVVTKYSVQGDTGEDRTYSAAFARLGAAAAAPVAAAAPPPVQELRGETGPRKIIQRSR